MRETFISLFENRILTEYKEYWKKRIYHIFSIFAFLPVWKFLQSKIHILRHSIWNIPAKMDFIKSSSESNNKLSLSKCSDAIMELLSRISLFHYPWSNSQSTKRTFFLQILQLFQICNFTLPFPWISKATQKQANKHHENKETKKKESKGIFKQFLLIYNETCHL